MRRQNALRSRQHFGTDPPWTIPRTAPRAPDNDNSFLLAQYGRDPQTPTMPVAQLERSHHDPGSGTEVGAQLDFFGTNEGVVTGYSSSATSDSSENGADAIEDDTATAAVDEGTANRGLPDHIRVRMQSQSMYIAQLEEQNLDLQEKYSLLQHELQELRAAARRPATIAAPVDEAAASAT